MSRLLSNGVFNRARRFHFLVSNDGFFCTCFLVLFMRTADLQLEIGRTVFWLISNSTLEMGQRHLVLAWTPGRSLAYALDGAG